MSSELSWAEIQILMNVLEWKIDYGGDVNRMRVYLNLYDKLNKISKKKTT